MPMTYWALIEHHRYWLSNDGIYVREIRENGALMMPVSQRIVREYGVARNIGMINGVDGNQVNGLQRLVDDINNSPWPDGLVDRANCCIALADAHHERCIAERRHRPISAVSKLMWFLRPDGWTMFDRYARIGLIGNDNNPLAFYEALEQRNFQDVAANITNICRNHGFGLFGERVIDKLLLFRGANAAQDGGENYYVTAQTLNHWHLQLLPEDYRKRLIALATEVAEALLPTEFAPLAAAG